MRGASFWNSAPPDYESRRRSGFRWCTEGNATKGFRIDLIVEDLVVVEVKAVSVLAPIHSAQVITYLKLTGCPVGLLINFDVPVLTNGVRRADSSVNRKNSNAPLLRYSVFTFR